MCHKTYCGKKEVNPLVMSCGSPLQKAPKHKFVRLIAGQTLRTHINPPPQQQHPSQCPVPYTLRPRCDEDPSRIHYLSGIADQLSLEGLVWMAVRCSSLVSTGRALCACLWSLLHPGLDQVVPVLVNRMKSWGSSGVSFLLLFKHCFPSPNAADLRFGE